MKTRRIPEHQPSLGDDGASSGDLALDQLAYIRQMALELRAMAAGARAPTLAYLLEMAALEAAEVIRVQEFRSGLTGDD